LWVFYSYVPIITVPMLYVQSLIACKYSCHSHYISCVEYLSTSCSKSFYNISKWVLTSYASFQYMAPQGFDNFIILPSLGLVTQSILILYTLCYSRPPTEICTFWVSRILVICNSSPTCSSRPLTLDCIYAFLYL
jgi:hypothetical protein